jgi:hypothetical protein
MPEEGRKYLEEQIEEYNFFNNNQPSDNNRYGRIKEVEEGHSREQQRKLALHRKSMVFDLSSKGYNQNRISAILHVSQALVSLDLAQLRKDAANSMKSYLEEKLPLIYQECYEGISQVISRSWEMINDPNTPNQTRVQLLASVADATQTKLDISCGGEVIENGIKYARQNINNRFVAIAKPEEILHSNDSNNPEEEQPDKDNNLATKKGNDDYDSNSSLTSSNNNTDNNVIGNNDNDNNKEDVIDSNDNDSNNNKTIEEEDNNTTDPFNSNCSSSFSSSSSSSQHQQDTTSTIEEGNIDKKNNNNNRRTRNSVF